MSQILISFIMIVNSMLFSYSMQPMSMGIMLLMQTLFMCIMVSMVSYTSWLSYILFLIFLGGMLVLFIYMTSVASNEILNKVSYTNMVVMVITTMIVTLILSMDYFMTNMMQINMEINNSIIKSMPMLPLYNNPTSTITVFMVLYLFLTLIVIVKVTKFNKGPMRPLN